MSNSFVTPGTVAHQAPLSIGFPRQESWNGLPFPSPSDLPNPDIKPTSSTLAGTLFTPEPPGKPSVKWGSDFVILHVFNQLSQHHLLKLTEGLWLPWHDKNALATVAIMFLCCPKSSLRFFHNVIWENPKEFFKPNQYYTTYKLSKQQGVHLKCIQCYISICISI